MVIGLMKSEFYPKAWGIFNDFSLVLLLFFLGGFFQCLDKGR